MWCVVPDVVCVVRDVASGPNRWSDEDGMCSTPIKKRFNQLQYHAEIGLPLPVPAAEPVPETEAAAKPVQRAVAGLAHSPEPAVAVEAVQQQRRTHKQNERLEGGREGRGQHRYGQQGERLKGGREGAAPVWTAK